MRTALGRASVPATLVLLAALGMGHNPLARADSAVTPGRTSAHGASASGDSAPVKSSSFSPHHAQHAHVYGAPIQPPILKRRTHHHKLPPAPLT
jgi:hypothetical protein